jgi:pimeloyl-ACP methyl ester carboxylesterase
MEETMDKEKLYYEVHNENKGEILLFIHGIGTSSWGWWQQLDAFNQYQIFLIDLPGHGKSAHIPWRNLKETIRKIADIFLVGKKIHIVGISLGGHVALELAKHYPEKINSVFISGITVVPMGPKILSYLIPIYSRMVEKNQKNTDKLYRLGRDYGLTEENIPRFIEDYRLVKRQTVENIFKELYVFNMNQSYAEISLPIIFVAGENEEKGIQYTLKKAPKIIKHAETALIPNAKHQWPVQKPVVFNQFLNQWLKKLKNKNSRM